MTFKKISIFLQKILDVVLGYSFFNILRLSLCAHRLLFSLMKCCLHFRAKVAASAAYHVCRQRSFQGTALMDFWSAGR